MMRERTWGTIAVRLALLIGIPLFGWYLYNRFEIVTLSAHEDGMWPSFDPESAILVDLRPGKIWGGEIAIFLRPGSQDFRIARVHGVAGDKMEMGPKGLQINGGTVFRGSATFARIPEDSLNLRVIPDGRFLLLNDHIHSLRKDSEDLGLIPPEWVLGRVVRRWPW